MPHYCYLARCADDSLYCGYTIDLKKREEAHNAGRGAKYTAGRGPVQIVYSEQFASKVEAMQREAEVKKLKKSEKESLVASS